MDSKELICLILAVAFTITGCGRVVGPVRRGMGRAAADSIEESIYESSSPQGSGASTPSPQTGGWNQHMASQARFAFSRSFSVGGYWPGMVDYQPGEWTKYEIFESEGSERYTVERALLKRTEEGDEWWRLSWSTGEKTWTYEALIEAQTNRLVRLRGRDPEGNTNEIPVEQETFLQPARDINKESIRGATTGMVELSTEAGSFNSRRVNYGSIAGSGQLNWWLNEEIPGGVVKYEISAPDGSATWTCQLLDYGSGAESKLNSF